MNSSIVEPVSEGLRIQVPRLVKYPFTKAISCKMTPFDEPMVNVLVSWNIPVDILRVPPAGILPVRIGATMKPVDLRDLKGVEQATAQCRHTHLLPVHTLDVAPILVELIPEIQGAEDQSPRGFAGWIRKRTVSYTHLTLPTTPYV